MNEWPEQGLISYCRRRAGEDLGVEGLDGLDVRGAIELGGLGALLLLLKLLGLLCQLVL